MSQIFIWVAIELVVEENTTHIKNFSIECLILNLLIEKTLVLSNYY